MREPLSRVVVPATTGGTPPVEEVFNEVVFFSKRIEGWDGVTIQVLEVLPVGQHPTQCRVPVWSVEHFTDPALYLPMPGSFNYSQFWIHQFGVSPAGSERFIPRWSRLQTGFSASQFPVWSSAYISPQRR